MNIETRRRVRLAMAGVAAVAILQLGGLAGRAFGQLGFQQQMQMQQWSQQQQRNNHGFERSAANSQQAFERRTERQRYGSSNTSNGRSSQRRGTTSRPSRTHETPIRVGDKIVTLRSPTAVQIGEEKVAEVKAGVTLSVIQRDGEWLGVRVPKDSRSVAGWIHVDDAGRLTK